MQRSAAYEHRAARPASGCTTRGRCAEPKSFALGRRLLPALALLLALSTIAVAQGPRLFSREWYAQFSGAYSQPVAPFRIVGDTVTLGGTTLRAIHAPGHTRGATIWMTTVEDEGRSYTVAFFTTTTPNPGVPLFDNPRHRNVVEDTRSTFRKLKAEREPDILLVAHPQAMFAQTAERMRKGERPHPLLNGAQAWTRQLATAEADFERRAWHKSAYKAGPP